MKLFKLEEPRVYGLTKALAANNCSTKVWYLTFRSMRACLIMACVEFQRVQTSRTGINVAT